MDNLTVANMINELNFFSELFTAEQLKILTGFSVACKIFCAITETPPKDKKIFSIIPIYPFYRFIEICALLVFYAKMKPPQRGGAEYSERYLNKKKNKNSEN
jgi:hypothetical protein